MRTYTKNQVDVLLKRETEVWLYSYADLITNLLAFFLLLLAVSKSDPGTVHKIQQSIAKVMGHANVVPTDPEYQNIVTDYIRKNDLQDSVAVQKSVEGVSLIFSGGLFFETLSAKLTPGAQKTLDQLSPLFQKMSKEFRIDIEGHADSRPLQDDDQFASNWELSAARAGSVVRYLALKGVRPARLRAIGYADTQPVSKDFDQNRRVVIRIGRGTHQ